ncbi:tRNA epoxyqueuosine(34) reductase QueG [Vallitalea okinawensis]|uniref:tRNA epoxyqueuosine(34) reductase QueG n=1 Tax=Vallitalea okinawensis TaxID=2078660 RepID=UPI000CFCF71A|nr:tRNA epoxyqueuosine(34) reductase QueG [Vallitalea okinawensis]
MKENLINYCRQLDINQVGITDIGPYNDLKTLLLNRYHLNTGFEENDIVKRIDPKLIMEDARSIIVCLFPYYVGVHEGNLSNYTYGRDYHLITRNLLTNIGDYLSSQLDNFNYQVFADTGPLVDRYLAYKAGLGFYGINSHLINDQYGSYFFIGYIVNNHPFEVDKPLDKRCYGCKSCVKACPGQIILDNYDIDGRGCRSFLTQKKELLTESEIEVIKKDSIIFGCDVCQRVCPHNKDLTPTPLKAFKEDLIFKLEKNDIETLSNKAFKRTYGHRAFSWRGKKLLLRNMDLINEQEK